MYNKTEALELLESEEAFMDSLVNFQMYFGLNVTGELDEDTRCLMITPRCGQPDVMQLNGTLNGTLNETYLVPFFPQFGGGGGLGKTHLQGTGH